MIETNIRIVQPGTKLALTVRRAEVITQSCSADLLERACNALRKRHGLAAVAGHDQKTLFVATQKIVPNLVIQEDDWRLELKDSGSTLDLRFTNRADRNLLAQLLERALIAQIERGTDLWALEGYRIWYQKNPFLCRSGIAAYRRAEIASVVIDEVGIGLVVDVSTAFFSMQSVAQFFDESLPENERRRLLQKFEFLSARQMGQKGTLLYDLGKSQTKCYFDSFAAGLRADSPMTIRVQGRNYPSLVDYYAQKHGLSVSGETTVARVTFFGIDRPQPVLADRLYLRIMNEALPDSLKQVDKIVPAERCGWLEGFWESLGEKPLGQYLPELMKGFWQPPKEKVFGFDSPALIFGKKKILPAPRSGDFNAMEAHYRDRLSYLNQYGCFQVPPAIARVLRVAVPQHFGEAISHQLAMGICRKLSRWTAKDIRPEVILYASTEEAINRLRREREPGVVLFVFNQDDPATYFNLAFELQGWRIKRITQAQFAEMAQGFQFALAAGGRSRAVESPKGWEGFLNMNALDLLQQMDCVPYAPAYPLHYEARLSIDVGADRRHFALSLLICRPGHGQPFRLETTVAIKSDPKKETINELILRDEIVRLCQRAVQAGFTKLSSILFLRDGRECGREKEGILATREQLEQISFLTTDARFDVVDFHKKSLKQIRLWNRNNDGTVENTWEGDGIRLDRRTVVLMNTGAVTLHQGTAEPVMICGHDERTNMLHVAADSHSSSQLNWSSPRVAQRLPIELKRTDDDLKNRAAQEIRRIK
jgi:hypothetical protein